MLAGGRRPFGNFSFPGVSQTIGNASARGQCPQVLAGTARKVAKPTRLCAYTPGGFQTRGVSHFCSGKVRIVSRTLSGLFPAGGFSQINRPRKRKRTNRENPSRVPGLPGESPDKSGKALKKWTKRGQKRTNKRQTKDKQRTKKGRTSPDRETPPLEPPPPRLAALDSLSRKLLWIFLQIRLRILH